MMKIKKLTLSDFRCYDKVTFQPHDEVSILVGGNGQGKTCLMEAIHLLGVGRSHRTNNDKEMIAFGKRSCTASVLAEHKVGNRDIDVTISYANAHLSKKFRIGSSPVKRIGDIFGIVPCVLFSPDDLRIIKDGPAERRRFIDICVSQVYPEYFFVLQKYAHALRQRNALITSHLLNAMPNIDALVEPWNEQLATLGQSLVAYRREYIELLQAEASRTHQSITGEPLRIQYECKADTKEAMLRSFSRLTNKCNGPHNDEYAIYIGGSNSRAYASQGQQRTAAIALKLASLFVMKNIIAETPILLLDDVMSELDAKRRANLLSFVEGVQTIITCTDASDIGDITVGATFRIEELGGR